jgi:hypothetical protein
MLGILFLFSIVVEFPKRDYFIDLLDFLLRFGSIGHKIKISFVNFDSTFVSRNVDYSVNHSHTVQFVLYQELPTLQ